MDLNDCIVLIVHDHECHIDFYEFVQMTQHKNFPTVADALFYDVPMTELTVILIINQAIKIDIMTDIFDCAR